MKRIMTATLALAVLLLTCSGCIEQPLSKTAVMLDTTCSITLYDGQNEELLDACFTLVSAREALWSRTVETSEVSSLNTAGGGTVSADTLGLLQTAFFYTSMTEGAFDITTGALTDLWRAAEESGTLPTDEALNTALATVGTDKARIEGDTVALGGGTLLDFGGIAKGQIADDVVTLLKASDCTSALIDLGGNIVAYGSKPNGDAFEIGIVDPRDPDKLAATVAVSDRSVVTSGSYERGYTIGDVTYSHILDPKTGRPVDNDLLSVTIISPMSVDGDVLSTACFVMGYEKAAALLEGFDDIEAVFVKTDGSVVTTDGVTLV